MNAWDRKDTTDLDLSHLSDFSSSEHFWRILTLAWALCCSTEFSVGVEAQDEFFQKIMFGFSINLGRCVWEVRCPGALAAFDHNCTVILHRQGQIPCGMKKTKNSYPHKTYTSKWVSCSLAISVLMSVGARQEWAGAEDSLTWEELESKRCLQNCKCNAAIVQPGEAGQESHRHSE